VPESPPFVGKQHTCGSVVGDDVAICVTRDASAYLPYNRQPLGVITRKQTRAPGGVEQGPLGLVSNSPHGENLL
jgi:hypothetical protein